MTKKEVAAKAARRWAGTDSGETYKAALARTSWILRHLDWAGTDFNDPEQATAAATRIWRLAVMRYSS